MKQIERFVDAHIHLWDLATGWYPSLEGEYTPDLNEYGVGDHSKIMGKNYLMTEYLADARNTNLTKLVHVTAAIVDDMTEETRWLQGLADNMDTPMAIVGWTDLARPIAEVEAELRRHAESPNFRGIRNQQGVDYTSEHIAEAFGVLNKLGLLYDAVANEENLQDAAKMVARFPNMHFVLEHTGWPTKSDKAAFEKWQAGMDAFAALPNTSCKISGLGMVMHAWTVDDFRPWVLHAIKAFGPDRCMFATNFPVDGVYSTYDELVGAFNEITQDFSDAERDAMFAANAERIYNI